MNGAGNVIETGHPTAGAVGKPDACARDLPRAAAPSQLADDLDNLCDPGRAHWVSLGKQTAARVHRNTATNFGVPFVDQPPACPR